MAGYALVASDMNNQKQQERTPASEDSVVKGYASGAVMALAVTLSFMTGIFVGNLSPSATGEPGEPRLVGIGSVNPASARTVEFEAYWEVWNMIKDRYVEKGISDVDLFYGSLAGMVNALDDPYSAFFDPEMAGLFARQLQGEFEGIGAEIGIKRNQLRVIAPLPDTPAERAGLRPGDAILAIDGEETIGMPLDEAVRRIRGTGGTEVRLLMYREGATESQEVVITRGLITVDPVKLEFAERDGKRFAHISISHFSEQTASSFAEAARKALLEDADGIVLDLRNNPGGYLDAAVKVAGEWVGRDTVLMERFSEGDERMYTSSGSARLSRMPTIVLVNGGSASSSEIVAGALQDHGKARVVGEQTFGKGSVQDYVEFPDGSAVKLTIATWYTPKGRSIAEEGIAPDVLVEYTEEDYDADRDPQLDRALELLVAAP